LQNIFESNQPIDLTFDLAEEIAEIGSSEADVLADILQRLRTPSLAPTIRLANITGAGVSFLRTLAATSPRASATWSAIAGADGGSTSLDPAPWEVVRVPPGGGHKNPLWDAFVWRLRRGAADAGTPAQFCNAFAHAMIELAENVIEHSERPSTGLAYYETLPDRFEFGVADSGIGVLASLQHNPTYAHLSDDLAAIRKSIEEGVSRFDEPGRGWGFRTIFRALRNSYSNAVIRSGTAGLRVHPCDQGHERIGFQRGSYQGLWVAASVPTKC
jgi:hypothetical protein